MDATSNAMDGLDKCPIDTIEEEIHIDFHYNLDWYVVISILVGLAIALMALMTFNCIQSAKGLYWNWSEMK